VYQTELKLTVFVGATCSLELRARNRLGIGARTMIRKTCDRVKTQVWAKVVISHGLKKLGVLGKNLRLFRNPFSCYRLNIPEHMPDLRDGISYLGSLNVSELNISQLLVVATT
jgi:hypothetical protein